MGEWENFKRLTSFVDVNAFDICTLGCLKVVDTFHMIPWPTELYL